MTEKWTKGPWSVSPEWPFPDDAGRRHDAVTVKSPNGEELLICSFEHAVMRGRQNANARLIKEAPNLYAALKRLTEEALSCGVETEHQEMVNQALDALNKARGEG